MTGVKTGHLDSDDADSDFIEDNGDQDTIVIDAAPAPPTTELTWPDYEYQKLQPAYEDPYSADHLSQNLSIVSSPPGSSPRTASAVDNADPPAEETTADPLDGLLSSVSYRERIHETEVQGAERFGS
ncbi:hypothetical protein ARMGADRAFT_568736 [Armillaria gallica]|uniref:Uncharacterized protein n=1 Tax=Armillaria gallica TaxID=47427 RepID=A0A2H3E9T0_ARMGA|nr:hypothetical protein ARMGADRAFT_568736 [Armillaria gallica]